MSKVLRTIAKVATVVAAVAKFIPGVGQVVAAVATAVALVAGTLATVTAKKPGATGVTNQFVIDRQAGIPYCIGRTFAGGRIVHVDGYGGAENPYRSYVIAFSGGGQSDSIESVLIDRSTVSVGSGGASEYYSGFMWLSTQLGASPEASALAAPFAEFPGWGASHKLSGYAAGLWTLKFDKKGKKFASGQPEFGVVGKWVKVYDPRLDSTFPGGSGPCRALQENTYVWSQNGPLHGLTWALGRWQNSKRALGVGIEAQDIDLQAFVDAANVFDANGWAVGGVLDGSGDKWNTLKTILWSGAAEPLDLGGLLSCRYESPKVSLATITGDDLADGDITVPAMKTWRERINSIIPRYRSEAHNWEIIPANAVRGTTYIAEDGEERTRESEYYCCQSLTQAAQLAAYEIALSREIDGISIPLKTKFIGYKPGDCLTINIPEANLNNQPVVVTNRTLDPATGIVTMTFRTETAAKHAWALGRTTSAPPSPSITSSAVMDALIWNNRAGIPEERFSPLSTYDFGRIVNLANGARYIYVSDTPTAGNAPPNVAYWTELSPATSPGDIGAATAAALSALDAAKSTVTFGYAFPAAATSQENDMFVHLGQNRRTYRRVAGDGFISIGGSEIAIGGDTINLVWTPADDDRIGQAVLEAAGAAALADGKAEVFVTLTASDPTPIATGQGDIWVKRHLTPVEVWVANSAGTWQPSATYGATNAQILDITTAQDAADTAQSNATSALSQIGAIVSDGILDKSEKPDVVLRYNAITAEQAGIDGNAVVYGITTEKAVYDNAVAALTSYLTGLSPAYNSYASDTPITRADFNQKFKDAYDTRQAVLNKIAQIAGTRASWSNISSMPGNVNVLTGSEPIQNTQIAVTGGNIQGIGTGNGTTVANNSIQLNNDGTISFFNGTSWINLGAVTITGMGGGALAFLNNVNPATGQVLSTGSTPPSIPDNSLSYSSDASSITITWPSLTIYRADGTTIAISSGSQAITGLSSANTYKVYPYVVDSGGTSGSISFVTGGSGSPSAAFASAGSASAAATMYGRGNIPMGSFLAATVASGSGGGGGGGSGWCLHPSSLVTTSDGFVRADTLKAGSRLATPEGWSPIVAIQRKRASRWIGLHCNGADQPSLIVTPTHVVYRADGSHVAAHGVRLGDFLSTDGDHAEVTRLDLIRDVADMVIIELAEPHLYYAGADKLLSHNSIQKP